MNRRQVLRGTGAVVLAALGAHVARAASQASFERAVYAGSDGDGPTTDDYLAALEDARPSVTDEVRAGFDADVADLAAWTTVANVLLNLDEMMMKR